MAINDWLIFTEGDYWLFYWLQSQFRVFHGLRKAFKAGLRRRSQSKEEELQLLWYE